MEVLSSRVLLRTADPRRLREFYGGQLGLAVAREYPGGVVFHAGNGLIEMHLDDPDGRRVIVVEIPPDHPLRRDTR